MSSLEAHIEREACPHLAVFLATVEQLPRVLADFYALGVRRGGWLAHRALPGGATRERELLTAAGLGVAELEAHNRMVVVEMDPEAPVEGSAEPWREALDDALNRGCSGLWYARSPIGPEQGAAFDHMLAIEREWHRMSRDRPVITLCPFIVGDLDGRTTLATLGRVSEMHTGVLVPSEDDGEYDLLRPG